jgi:hypothetical protein
MGETRNEYIVSVGKREGKRLFWSRRRRWEDNIKIMYEEVIQKGVDSYQLAKVGEKMVDSCEHGNKSSTNYLLEKLVVVASISRYYRRFYVGTTVHREING